MVKIAVISLACKQDERAPSALLERELRESLMNDDRISSRWKVEKVTILDDAELVQGGRPSSPTFTINRSGNQSRMTH